LFLKSPPPLILGSTSVYRRELLTRLQIPFECHSPGVDETPLPGERARELVVRLARQKAQAVAERHPEAWVIGSDQVALLSNASQHDLILGKPGSVAKCIEQLEACSGRTVDFVTAVAVVHRREAALVEFIDTTRVSYRNLDRDTIKRYVEREGPLDCAGGFKSEALGITLCESIDSRDPTALTGLPLIRLCAVLRDAGFELP
jgi:7-methyl-GTP pyrophosphatase